MSVSEEEILTRARNITERMVANIRDAGRFIAVREGFRDLVREPGALTEALSWHTPLGLDEVMRSLAISTILSILRVSENPTSNNSMSGCLLVGVLNNEQIVPLLIDGRRRKRTEDTPDRIFDYEREQQPQRIAEFKSLVPLGWGRPHFPPTDDRLDRARNSLREIRDRAIAHSDARAVIAPDADQIRAGFEITRHITELASLIFLGNTSGLGSNAANENMQKKNIWTFFKDGLVSAHEQWSDEARADGVVLK
jgi:hypothetical protein